MYNCFTYSLWSGIFNCLFTFTLCFVMVMMSNSFYSPEHFHPPSPFFCLKPIDMSFYCRIIILLLSEFLFALQVSWLEILAC